MNDAQIAAIYHRVAIDITQQTVEFARETDRLPGRILRRRQNCQLVNAVFETAARESERKCLIVGGLIPGAILEHHPDEVVIRRTHAIHNGGGPDDRSTIEYGTMAEDNKNG